MSHFAFVRRGADGQYSATLPDFPGRVVRATALSELDDAIRAAVAPDAAARGSLPPPTAFEALPRQSDDHDGYWLMIDLSVHRGNGEAG